MTPMQWKKPLVIVNPRAGRFGSERGVSKLITTLFAPSGITPEIRFIAGSSDARTWAEHARREGFDLVIVAGGDGTVNEAITGLQQGGMLPVAILPVGTTNLLVQELGIPKALPKAVAMIEKGVVRPIDVGRITTHGRYMLAAAVIGYGSRIFVDARQEFKSFFGYPAYVLAALKNIIRVPTAHFRCTLDGEERIFEAQMVLVANTNFATLRPLNLGPTVRIDDGVLDVVVFSHANFLATAELVANVVLQPGKPKPHVLSFTARHVTVETSPTLPVSIDGELVESAPMDIRVVPNAVSIIVPEDGKKPSV